MIHFDMKLENFIGKGGFNETRNQECVEHNQIVIARSKQLFLDSQPYNIWPVIASIRKETPLEREYPYTAPSIRPGKK